MEQVMTESETAYYYHGLNRVLIRYRRVSVFGWGLVFATIVASPWGWNISEDGAALRVLLSALAILAGLTLVWQNITALEEYLRVPFPSSPHPATNHPAIEEIQLLMKEVDDGGWQDAYAAIAGLRAIGEKHGLPPLKN